MESQSKTERTGPKDVFLHLLSVITLYVSVGTMIALVFQYINILIPDPLEANYYYISGIYSSIRWFISVLIVVFPVYAWTLWYLGKGYVAFPEKLDMRSRKWLVYLTLFLAALIIIGDLIALVYNLLQGGFTSRFLLKIATVFLISGAVFVYYLWEVRRSVNGDKTALVKAVSYIAIAAVAAVIVGGFFIVGSPAEERAYQFDEQRVQALQAIQSEIFYFYQAKSALPDNLSELKSDVRGFIPPIDPETGTEYAYRKSSNLQFELCADFSRPNRGNLALMPAYMDPYYAPENWQHDAGRGCFTRTIDPSLLPPIEKPIR